MRLRVAAPLVLFLVAGAALVAWGTRGRPRPLVLAGSVEVRDVEVGSLVGGRVAAVHVDEGAAVRAGQLLVTLEADLIDPEIREQQARLDAAGAVLERVRNGPRPEEVARARVDWRNAEAERVRIGSLLAQGIVGQQAYDDAEARAAAALEFLQELERGSRREDILEAEAAVAREASRLEWLRERREETEVRSPVDGVIESFDLRPGDLVQANQPVATVLEEGQLWVRVFVPEPSLGLVRIGQEAAVTVDTFPGREFPGRVVEIRDRGEFIPRNIQTLDQRGDQVFGVKVAVDPTPDLKAGMAATVRLRP